LEPTLQSVQIVRRKMPKPPLRFSLSYAVATCNVKGTNNLLSKCDSQKQVDDLDPQTGMTTLMYAARGRHEQVQDIQTGAKSKTKPDQTSGQKFREIIKSIWQRHKEVGSDLESVLLAEDKQSRNVLGNAAALSEHDANVDYILSLYILEFRDLSARHEKDPLVDFADVQDKFQNRLKNILLDFRSESGSKCLRSHASRRLTNSTNLRTPSNFYEDAENKKTPAIKKRSHAHSEGTAANEERKKVAFHFPLDSPTNDDRMERNSQVSRPKSDAPPTGTRGILRTLTTSPIRVGPAIKHAPRPRRPSPPRHRSPSPPTTGNQLAGPKTASAEINGEPQVNGHSKPSQDMGNPTEEMQTQQMNIEAAPPNTNSGKQQRARRARRYLLAEKEMFLATAYQAHFTGDQNMLLLGYVSQTPRSESNQLRFQIEWLIKTRPPPGVTQAMLNEWFPSTKQFRTDLDVAIRKWPDEATKEQKDEAAAHRNERQVAARQKARCWSRRNQPNDPIEGHLNSEDLSSSEPVLVTVASAPMEDDLNGEDSTPSEAVPVLASSASVTRVKEEPLEEDPATRVKEEPPEEGPPTAVEIPRSDNARNDLSRLLDSLECASSGRLGVIDVEFPDQAESIALLRELLAGDGPLSWLAKRNICIILKAILASLNGNPSSKPAETHIVNAMLATIGH